MLKVSHSSMEVFRRCPMEYYLSRVVNAQPNQERRALEVGSAFHVALNAYHRGDEMESVLSVWHSEAVSSKLSKEDQICGELLLLAYDARWGRKENGGKVEKEFCVPIVGPSGRPEIGLLWRGFVDVDLSPAAVVDHKTTSRKLTVAAVQELSRDPQAEEYIIATGAEKAIWDVVRFPKESRRLATPEDQREFYVRDGKHGKKGDPKPGTYLEDESWEDFRERMVEEIAGGEHFARSVITPTEEELERRKYDVWATAKAMESARANGAFFRNEKSCNDYGGCPYKPVCWEGVDPARSDLYTIEKRGR